jgi:hypothetical protein
MQLGLMAKLIGKPVEVKALPVTLSYAPSLLRWEAGKSAAGAGVCFAIVLGLQPSLWVGVPVAVVGGLFVLYGLQQWRRGGLHYEVDQQAATFVRGTRRESIPWGQMDGFRLHFYAFGRKAREGTLEVRLSAGRRRFKVDSAIDHFPTLLVQAAGIARERGLPLDPTTQANLDQLGL